MDNNEIGNEYSTHERHKKLRQHFIWNNRTEEATCGNCIYIWKVQIKTDLQKAILQYRLDVKVSK
jgi:hypothetical protein